MLCGVSWHLVEDAEQSDPEKQDYSANSWSRLCASIGKLENAHRQDFRLNKNTDLIKKKIKLNHTKKPNKKTLGYSSRMKFGL